jgi:isochorismate hydrolase
LIIEIDQNSSKMEAYTREIRNLRQECVEKQQIIEDILATRKLGEHSNVDSRLMSEIRETRMEYSEASRAIARHESEIGNERRMLDDQLLATIAKVNYSLYRAPMNRHSIFNKFNF